MTRYLNSWKRLLECRLPVFDTIASAIASHYGLSRVTPYGLKESGQSWGENRSLVIRIDEKQGCCHERAYAEESDARIVHHL